MKQRENKKTIPYSNLVDNIKVLLIFLVVFNHIIAFQLVKEDIVVRYVWYAITIFHMPAFIFVSGYLSKKPQNVLKNLKNLLIPYILGYSLTWYSQIWLGNSMDYELLRPSGTVMWYLLALFVYRLTIEAMGKVRFIVPLSIIVALWAGTRPEFTTYLSSSRIVVFFPFFAAGYLWKSEYTDAIRRFKGKWVLIPISGILLYGVPNYMIAHDMPIDIFRGNHSYLVSGLSDEIGMILRILMYLVSFVLIFTFFAVMPDIRLPLTFIGRNTMGIYFFHYPIMIIMNGLLILKIPALLNVWSLLGISLIFILVLGSPPIDWLYTGCLNLLTFILFKKEKKIQDEGLEDEYDSEEKKYEILRKRRQAIEELAATLETEQKSEFAQQFDIDLKKEQDKEAAEEMEQSLEALNISLEELKIGLEKEREKEFEIEDMEDEIEEGQS